MSIVMGGGGAENPLVTAAHCRGGGGLPASPLKVWRWMQVREAESKVAARPSRVMATYLRELGISHMKKKLRFCFKSSRVCSAAEGVRGGRGNSVSRNWVSSAAGEGGTSSGGICALEPTEIWEVGEGEAGWRGGMGGKNDMGRSSPQSVRVETAFRTSCQSTSSWLQAQTKTDRSLGW